MLISVEWWCRFLWVGGVNSYGGVVLIPMEGDVDSC